MCSGSSNAPSSDCEQHCKVAEGVVGEASSEHRPGQWQIKVALLMPCELNRQAGSAQAEDRGGQGRFWLSLSAVGEMSPRGCFTTSGDISKHQARRGIE